MRLPTEKELRWREIDDKINMYLNREDKLKEGAPDWAKELYKEWQKLLEETRAEAIEDEKKNGSIEY